MGLLGVLWGMSWIWNVVGHDRVCGPTLTTPCTLPGNVCPPSSEFRYICQREGTWLRFHHGWDYAGFELDEETTVAMMRFDPPDSHCSNEAYNIGGTEGCANESECQTMCEEHLAEWRKGTFHTLELCEQACQDNLDCFSFVFRPTDDPHCVDSESVSCTVDSDCNDYGGECRGPCHLFKEVTAADPHNMVSLSWRAVDHDMTTAVSAYIGLLFIPSNMYWYFT